MGFLDILEYQKAKLKLLSAEELAWQKFKLTGSINDAMFLLAVSGLSRGKEWMNSDSRELL